MTSIRPAFLVALLTATAAFGVTSVMAAAVTSGACGNNYTYTDGNRYMTSDFGERTSQQGSQGDTSSFHKGVDIRVNQGEPATSNSYMDGTVVMVNNDPDGYGNYVIVQHTNGLRTLYAHATSINVTVGQSVSAGDVLGDYSGSCTGNCTGPHIHFETQVLNNDGGWTKVDPAVVEGLVASGECPSDSALSYFNLMATARTEALHGVSSDQLQNGGQNMLQLDICAGDLDNS